MFAAINLEADIHLIDLDDEIVPPRTHAVTLIIRQGIEVLIKDAEDHPSTSVFVELRGGQIQVSVWDIFSDSLADEPVVHLLKDVSEREVEE